MPSPNNGPQKVKIGIRLEFFDDFDIGGIREAIGRRLMNAKSLRLSRLMILKENPTTYIGTVKIHADRLTAFFAILHVNREVMRSIGVFCHAEAG